MTDPEELLRQAAADLAAAGARWALIGALAVGARSEPRFTRDVDIAIAVADDSEAQALVLRLRESGYEVHSTVEQERTGRLATVRLVPPGGDADAPVLDLLFASSGIEPEAVAAGTESEVFPDQRVPVARTGHLIALKLLSDAEHRVFDKADLFALVGEADAEEIERARDAVRLIVERGTNRGRDLVSALEELLATKT